MNWFLVILGGALGAPVRYLTGRVVKARWPTTIPWGTFAVNIAAAFLLALFVEGAVRGAVGPDTTFLMAVGFSGALSTWSTFSYELLTLGSSRQVAAAGLYLAATVAIGLGMSFAGAALARSLW